MHVKEPPEVKIIPETPHYSGPHNDFVVLAWFWHLEPPNLFDCTVPSLAIGMDELKRIISLFQTLQLKLLVVQVTKGAARYFCVVADRI